MYDLTGRRLTKVCAGFYFFGCTRHTYKGPLCSLPWGYKDALLFPLRRGRGGGKGQAYVSIVSSGSCCVGDL